MGQLEYAYKNLRQARVTQAQLAIAYDRWQALLGQTPGGAAEFAPVVLSLLTKLSEEIYAVEEMGRQLERYVQRGQQGEMWSI